VNDEKEHLQLAGRRGRGAAWGCRDYKGWLCGW